jgi:hypothetical protein
MPRILLLIAFAGAVAGGLLYTQFELGAPQRGANVLIEQYCLDCHNVIDLAGELRLDDKDASDVSAHPEVWESVVRKLRTGMMPPAGEPRPERSELNSVAAELEARLDANAPNIAYEETVLRRLNRTEYANAIRDLLHVDIDAKAMLPLDDSSEGFDNVATALGVSPSLIEAYISAALKISRRALGDRTAPPSQISYTAPQRLVQDRHLDGLPLGTRGGMRIEHDFPLDAEYEFRVRSGFRRAPGASLDVTLDGAPVALTRAGTIRLPVTAGPHVLTAAIVDSRRPVGVDDIYARRDPPAGVSSVEIVGPLEVTGTGNTPGRRRILTCDPQDTAEEARCAESIIASVATRAFRRPLSREQLEPMVAFYTDARRNADFESGIRNALARILVDPRFLYRFEPAPAAVGSGERYRIDDFGLAARLAFFLWSSIPDDALLEVAASGTLHEPAKLVAEIRRMLMDSKADALVENFAAQWLFLRELDSVTPDAADFDENLRLAMTEETQRLFAAVMHDDLSVIRLLDAEFTYLNDRLAEHYGINDIHGSYFRRVDLPLDSPRRGLLGHASILTVTSVTNRTSPVIRGSWILETLLGSPAPVPPPNVETTLAGDNGDAIGSTVRARLEAHRGSPTCASCHAIMDPIGFSLENFDLIGAWRDTDEGMQIDTRATLADGTRIDGPGELREALLARSDAFVTTLTEKLLTYALGRGIEYSDMPTVRAIVREAEKADYRFSALIEGIVLSEPFLTRVKGVSEQ